MAITHVPPLQIICVLSFSHHQSFLHFFDLSVDGYRLENFDIDEATELVHHEFVALVPHRVDALVEGSTIFYQLDMLPLSIAVESTE